MMIGMTTEKIAVSLPSDVLDRARGAVRRGRAMSMSAYVAQALEEKAKLDDLDALLAEMLEETGGPASAAERREADRLLKGGAPSDARSRKEAGRRRRR